jgi:hypothetical protein
VLSCWVWRTRKLVNALNKRYSVGIANRELCPFSSKTTHWNCGGENPIHMRVMAIRLDEIAVYRVSELDWRCSQWWLIGVLCPEVSRKHSLLLVTCRSVLLVILPPWRCGQYVPPKWWWVYIHRMVSRLRILKLKLKLNSMVWVCERTIPAERPPLVGEVIANFCG